MPLFPDANTDVPAEDVGLPTEETPIEEPVEEKNIPDIELIVEDGIGVSNANAYCDLDFAMEYCTMKGYTDWQNLSEDEQKVFIIRGTEFVDNFYNWKGRKHSQSQSMAFPRDDIYDIDRYRVIGIPDKLKKACLEAAWLNNTNGSDTLFSSKDVNGQVKRQKVDTLEVEYFAKDDNTSSVSSQIDYTTIYDILNKLLKGLYKTSSSTSKVSGRLLHTGW